jgi:hypothetical protein
MFYYIKNDEDAKNLYTIFVEVYNNELYKNLSENDQYKLIEHIYFEKYIKQK